MEYNILDFVDKLKKWFVGSAIFPEYVSVEIGNTFGSKYRLSKIQTDESKHPNRTPLHLKEAADKCINRTTVIGDNIITFDLGDEQLEKSHPYFHILEDAPAIRKRNMGTTKTKGTQEMIKEVGKRNYGYVYWNGKTFTKEYSKNVRGSRNRTSSVSHWGIENGKSIMINRESNSYKNVHYRYIENILNLDVVDRLCSEFGLRKGRVVDTGLIDEFAVQEDTTIDKIKEIFDSFNE